MSSGTLETDQEFLLRAASVFDPNRGSSHQRDLFLQTWSLLTPQARQQTVLEWRSDQGASVPAPAGSGSGVSEGVSGDPAGQPAVQSTVESASNDPGFLLRAASVYDPASATSNQSTFFRQVWAQVSPGDQKRLVSLWRQPDPFSAPAPAAPAGREVPEEGLALIRNFEGYAKALPDGRAQAYPDPIAGWQVPTIGFGTTRYPNGQQVRQGDVISRDQADACLKDAVERQCRPSLERIHTWGQMNSHQRSALYSFAYNLGPAFYGGADFASITRVCDSPERWGDKTWVSEQFIKYRNPGSAAETGLRRRRQAEADLFCRAI